MEKVEKSMKRWLKRRVKVSLATIVAFLITGIASYSSDKVITTEDLVENTWTNEESIEGQVSLDKTVQDKKIILENNNQIISDKSNIDITGQQGQNIGNGISYNNYFDEDKESEFNQISKIILGNIINSGKILGSIGNIQLDKIDFNYDEEDKLKISQIATVGNGINIFGLGEKESNIEIGDIINNLSGNIEGTVENIAGEDNRLIIAGNGISIVNTGILEKLATNKPNISTYIEKIVNDGVIKGKANDVSSRNIAGNGIAISNYNLELITSEDRITGINTKIQINGIKNNGEITGEVTGNIKDKWGIIENMAGTVAGDIIAGNGIAILNKSEYFENSEINIGDIENNGKIVGKINGNIECIYSGFNIILGNGISIYSNEGDIITGNIKNSGEISGNVTSENIESGFNLGNGISLYGNNIEIKNIENSGEISGSVTGNISDGFLIGNGINILGKIKAGDIINNGKIIGKVIGENIEGSLLGNGINLYGIDIEIGNILNNGEIQGEVTGNISEIYLSGNGISIYNADGNIKVGNILNSGKINGNNGIIFFANINDGKTEKIEIENIINNGEINGEVENNQFTNGNGIIFTKENYSTDFYDLIVLEINNFINKGKILGKDLSDLQADSNNEINNFSNGNGVIFSIGSDTSGQNGYSIPTIENIGLISGEYNRFNLLAHFDRYGEGYYNTNLGNGIIFFNPYAIKNNFINNEGIILGKSNDIVININPYSSTYNFVNVNTGNGIGISSNDGTNLSIENIKNTGKIVGNVDKLYTNINIDYENEKDKYFSSISAGNGIGILSTMMVGDNFGNLININMKNSGIIVGNINEFKLNQELLGNLSLGNGISINTDYLSKEIEKSINKLDFSLFNEGLISGNAKNLSKGLNAGNGILISLNDSSGVENSIDLNIENNGKISGSISENLEGILFSGNGIAINLTDGISNIENSGIIVGSIIKTKENTSGSFLGNGINIINGSTLINNSGIISGNSTENISEETLSGMGIFISSEKKVELKNTGLIKGKSYGVGIDTILDYTNGGIVVGQIPVYGEEFIDDISKSADKGVAIKLDEEGNIVSITNGTGGTLDDKEVINADVSGNNSSISIDSDTSYANNIINGAGVGSATLEVNANTTVDNSIINAYHTAVNVNGADFTANNTIINGGGLDGSIAVITGNGNISLDNSTINGNVELDSEDSSLSITNSQLNGDISGGAGTDNLTLGGLNAYHKIDGFENINFKGDTTLYETSSITGATNIDIESGTQVNLRIDSSVKDEDGTYKTHSIYNSSDNKLTISGDTDKITEDDVDDNGDMTVEENENEDKYDKVSILNLVTNGLGREAVIDLGNTKVEDTVWVKTDSILNQATKNETEDGTTITIEAEKDLFEINKKFDKPIEPSGKYYVKLNDIYKGIHTSNDNNFNALNSIITGTLTEANKGDYTTITEEQQMATLLAYLKEIYTETPYSFSSEASRKSLDMFANIIKENNFKAKDGEIITYVGLTHNNGEGTDKYYGKNYHGFDIGSSDTDVDSQITGAYGQLEKGLSDSTSVGLILGGNSNKVDVSSSNLKGSSGYIGSYLKHDRGAFRGTIGVGLQYTDWKAHRNDLGGAYKENYSDRGLNIYAEGKYSKELSKGLFLEPKAGLNYDYIKQESINEGEKALSLSVDEKEFNTLTGNVGVDLRKEIITEKGKHNLTAGVNYTRILSGADEDNLTGNFGGNSFDILVPQKTKDNVSVGLKYDIELENGVMLGAKASYDVPFKESTDNHTHKGRGEWTVGIGVGYRFNSLKELNPINIVDSFREERKVNLSSENYFDFDKSEIKAEGKAVIKAISSEIEKEGLKGTLKIEGHTDSIGTSEYNQKLSERRAKSVEEEFKKNVGTEKVKYETRGYGESKPLDTNTTSEGRARNRRVDIEFTENK